MTFNLRGARSKRAEPVLKIAVSPFNIVGDIIFIKVCRSKGVVIGYLQLTPEENKKNYLKGFKIGHKEIPEPQPPEPVKPKKKDSDVAYSQPSDLEKQLAVRLALGEINQETYNQALNMLKSVNKPDDTPLYG